jgi:archaellum biogenesis protein FlaJ (TadC family)
MEEKKNLVFIFSFSITIISLLFIIFNINLVFSETVYLLVLMVALLNFIIAIVYLRRLLVEIKYDNDERKEKEKNVRDCYQYYQLLNPSEINN